MYLEKFASALEKEGFTIDTLDTTGSEVTALKATKGNKKVLIQRDSEEVIGECATVKPLNVEHKETAQTSDEVARKLLKQL